MPIGGLVQGGTSLIGSIFGGKKGSDAAKTAGQQQVTQQQNALNIEQGNTLQGQQGYSNANAAGQGALQSAIQSIMGMYTPYSQAGQQANTQLQSLAGPGGALSQQFSFNPSNLQNDPGYQFTLGQGQQAIQRSAAASGSLNSTGTEKSLANYTTGTANQYFNDAYNRALSTFNTNRQGTLAQAGIYQGLSGEGLAATQGGANATQNLTGTGVNLGYQTAAGTANLLNSDAQQQANTFTNIGNAEAAATTGSAQAWQSAMNGGVNAINGAAAGYANNPFLGSGPPITSPTFGGVPMSGISTGGSQ